VRMLEVAKATAPLAQYARRARREPVILTEDGRPVAALVPIRESDLETVALSINPQFVALIQRSRARRKFEGGISSAAARRRLGLNRRARRV
jgi:prevent-host-death family protein